MHLADALTSKVDPSWLADVANTATPHSMTAFHRLSIEAKSFIRHHSLYRVPMSRCAGGEQIAIGSFNYTKDVPSSVELRSS